MGSFENHPHIRSINNTDENGKSFKHFEPDQIAPWHIK